MEEVRLALGYSNVQPQILRLLHSYPSAVQRVLRCKISVESHQTSIGWIFADFLISDRVQGSESLHEHLWNVLQFAPAAEAQLPTRRIFDEKLPNKDRLVALRLFPDRG